VWIDVPGDAPGVIGGPDERRFGLVEPTQARLALSGVPRADLGQRSEIDRASLTRPGPDARPAVAPEPRRAPTEAGGCCDLLGSVASWKCTRSVL
jgi:hypothetical protein